MSATGIVAKPVANPVCPLCGAALPAGAPPLGEVACPACGKAVMAPGALAQYRLVGLIGAGGMGAVYEAVDEGLQRRVAVKVILREKAAEDPGFIERFRREAQSAAKLQHPNIVTVYAFGESEGQPFLVMELVRPDSLDRMMRRGPVQPATALNVGMQIAQGLKAAAEQGMVHGDVKPENILINEAREAKLADFGIAALVGAHAADDNEVWGTPYYIAPETLRKQKVDLRADIYSLGGTLYHAIAGVPPFEGADAVEVMKARLLGPAKPLGEVAPGCPEAVSKIVMRMLEAEPLRRYPNYDSLLSDMGRELRAAKSRTGAGKRIVIKGMGHPSAGPSRPMPVVENPNAPLIAEKKPGLSKGAIIGLAAGVGCGVPLVVVAILAVILVASAKKTAEEVGEAMTNAVAQVAAADPAQLQAAADRRALAELGEACAALATARAAQAGETEATLKWLVGQARRAVVLPEQEVWLAPHEGEAPAKLFADLQDAFAKRDLVAEAAKGADALRAKVDGLRVTVEPPDAAPEAVAKALADARAARKAYDDTPAAKGADAAAKAVAALRKGWRAAVAEGRDALEAANRARLKAAAEAEAKAKAEEAEEARRQAIADEVASVADLEAAVSGDLGAFRPDAAAKAFAARAARLKSDEAKAAAQVVADRIAALAQVREWLIESAKGGALKGFGVSAADAEGITVGGARQTWEDFAIRQQGLSFRIFNTLLADDQGAWGLSTLRRAELAIGARQFVLRYFGATMLEKSKSLRDMMDRLKAVADRLPATRAALGRLEPQGSGE